MRKEQKEIASIIDKISGKYAAQEVFTDWVKMYAIAIQNGVQLIHDDVWRKREKQYIDTAKKYSDDDLKKMTKAYALLNKAMFYSIEDHLGNIYMQLDGGSKKTGQFFTPFEISELGTKVILNTKEIKKAKENRIYKIYEPTCGSGSMIIATALEMKLRGLNYQKILNVEAQDIDWRSVYMTYVQLSLYGIKAVVKQGNTLEDTYESIAKDRVFRTPAESGLII